MAKASSTPTTAPADETAPAVDTDPFAALTVVDADTFLPALNVSPTIVAMVDALDADHPKALPIGALSADQVKTLLRDVRAYGKRVGKKVTIKQGVVGATREAGLKFSISTPRAPRAAK